MWAGTNFFFLSRHYCDTSRISFQLLVTIWMCRHKGQVKLKRLPTDLFRNILQIPSLFVFIYPVGRIMETIRIIECRTAGIPVTHIFQNRNIPIICETMLDRPGQSSRILYQSHAIQAMQVYHQCFRLFLQRPCYIRSSQEKTGGLYHQVTCRQSRFLLHCRTIAFVNSLIPLSFSR